MTVVVFTPVFRICALLCVWWRHASMVLEDFVRGSVRRGCRCLRHGVLSVRWIRKHFSLIAKTTSAGNDLEGAQQLDRITRSVSWSWLESNRATQCDAPFWYCVTQGGEKDRTDKTVNLIVVVLDDVVVFGWFFKEIYLVLYGCLYIFCFSKHIFSPYVVCFDLKQINTQHI